MKRKDEITEHWALMRIEGQRIRRRKDMKEDRRKGK